MNENSKLMPFKAAPGSLLISFEGIEGAGKTTQIHKVKDFLESNGKTVHLFREPGATDLGEQLRSVILGQSAKLNPLTEALIFAAARVELIDQKLSKILSNENQVILLDRFIDSSFAYQGIASHLGIGTIKHIHSLAPLNQMPHLTFYLAISIETSFARQQSRGNQKDYFEKQGKSFHQKLKNGFDEVAKKWPGRVKKIDAEKNEAEVFQQIITYLNALLDEVKR